MKIYLKVTWPVCQTVCLSQSDRLSEFARKLKCWEPNFRQDLGCFTKDKLYIRGLFGVENRVPDVDRYEIVRCGNDITVEDHQLTCGEDYVSTYPYVDRSAESNSAEAPRTLVIVLESPHSDEYGCSVTEPIAPARGKTGESMHKHLGKILNASSRLKDSLPDGESVRVVITNPVPFQTSAYAIHGGRLKQKHWKPLRDAIWKALWDLKKPNPQNGAKPCFVLQKKFCDKLRSYNPIAIINACTNMGQSKVTKTLCDRCIAPLYEADHPSSWRSDTKLTRICPPSTGTDPK